MELAYTIISLRSLLIIEIVERQKFQDRLDDELHRIEQEKEVETCKIFKKADLRSVEEPCGRLKIQTKRIRQATK